MTAEDGETIMDALRLAIRRCECDGTGISITWDLNGGAPIEKCKRCKPYRSALAQLLRLTRIPMPC